MYCVGPETLQQQLWSEMRIRESVEQCQKYLDDFFVTYPGVHRYIEDTKRFAERYHFTYTFTGRRRRFPIASYDRGAASRMARQAVNARIQTTSSDLVQHNIIDVHNWLLSQQLGRVLLTVHDSIVFQAPIGTTGVMAELQRMITDNTAERAPWLPVVWKFDVGKGINYGEAHDEVV